MLSRSGAGTGIDLGHQSIKLVRVEPGRPGGAMLTHWGVEEVDPADESRGHEQALKRLLKGLKLKPRQLGRVASCISGRDVYLRQVSMPALSEDELRRALPFEAKKHFPLDTLPNPVLDFQILGPSPQSNGNGGGGPESSGSPDAENQEVLLVAAPRRRRDEALRVLATAGIDPELVGAEPLPTVNAVLDSHPDDTGELMVVVGLGFEVSFLAAVDPEGGLYARNLTFSGEALTKCIEEKLNFDRVSAESMKRDLSGPESEQVLALLEDPIRELVAEIAETVRFLGVRRRNRRFGRLFVCGGAALTSGLVDELSRGLGVKVGYPDPFLGLLVPGQAVIEENDRVRLVSAVGLARGWGKGEV